MSETETSTGHRIPPTNRAAMAAIAGMVIGAGSMMACGPAGGAMDVDGTAVIVPEPSAAKRDSGASPDAAGQSAPVDAAFQPPVNKICTVDAQCANGFCVDGVCCDRACDGACESCALTGKVGTCSPIKNAMDDVCGGDSICDDAGACRKLLGKACGSSIECASRNCVDGVCCGSAACGTCQSCAMPGSEGTCTVVAKFTDDIAHCSADETCDGLGMCRAKNGTKCSKDADCTSLNCIDGICCNVACAGSGTGVGTCRSCSEAGSVGTCIDARCKYEDGESCTVNADCLNGSCVTSYRDGDGDGYGSGKISRCEPAPAAGYVRAGGDCCDSDPETHPGVSSYSSAVNACGGFDRNCDGKTERSDGSSTVCGCVGPNVGKLTGQICTACR